MSEEKNSAVVLVTIYKETDFAAKKFFIPDLTTEWEAFCKQKKHDANDATVLITKWEKEGYLVANDKALPGSASHIYTIMIKDCAS